jgi:hypothetical protein
MQNTPPGIAMSQGYNQQLPSGQQFQAALPRQANLYNPATEETEEHRRLAAAMGAAGLRSIVHNGQVIKEYMAVPFQQRWRKRPYGFTRDAAPTGQQQA